MKRVTTQTIATAARCIYESELQERLERGHFGQYVMVNARTGEYVVGPNPRLTIRFFRKRFGKGAPGFCMRIGERVTTESPPMPSRDS